MTEQKAAIKKVKLVFLGAVSRVTKKFSDELSLESDEMTFRDLVAQLTNRYGKQFWEYLITPEGELDYSVVVLLNGRNICTLGGPEAKVTGGSEVEIAFLPQLSGG